MNMEDNQKEDMLGDRLAEYNLKIAYKNGILDGLRRCSWWEDGIQYVGTSKKTLDSAIQDVEKEYQGLEP